MKIEDLKKIAVIGAGDMGHGIVQVVLMAGYKVNLCDIKQEFVDRGISRIYASLDKLASKGKVDSALEQEIRQQLRVYASPHHVPAKIIQCPDYPHTINGKKVESSVTNIINNRKISNRDALANPEILDFYEQQAKLLQEE